MFMNTSLAQYQLPLFGVGTPSLATEIGADHRSIFVQPITAAGVVASESWPATVEVQNSDLVSREYRSWLARVTDYQSATGESSAGEQASASDAAAASEDQAASGTTSPDTDGSQAASDDGTGNGGTSNGGTNNGGSNNGGTNNSQNGTSSSANSGNQNGLLGFLFG